MVKNDNTRVYPRSQGVTSTSRSLLERARDNDREAWDRLVILYTPLVYHWCQKLDLATDDTPDVVQEVFKSVAEHISGFRKERPQDTFRGWLRVITRNKAIDFYRRLATQAKAPGGTDALHRLAQVPAPEIYEELDEDADDCEARNALFQQALQLIRGEFHERTWRAFWRVVVDDLTPTEVAEELEMSAGAVRVAKCRVLQRLRQDLGEQLVE